MNDKIALMAESFVGKSRWELGINQSGEWCAETVSHVLMRSVDPNKEVFDISCNNMKAKMKKSKNWCEPDGPIERGDILFPDHDREKDPLKDSKPLDHVVVVTGYDGEYVYYVDGNGDSSDLVKSRKRHISTYNFDCAYPDYYMRYCGEAEEEKPKEPEKTSDEYTDIDGVRILKKGCKGKDVEAMQAILIEKGYSCGKSMADGDFGANTEKAVINFQTDKNLECTGICDAKTWKQLIIG